MQHAGEPQELWGEALQAVIYTRNRATLRVGTKETPEGLWAPHPTSKPSVSHLHVWGCDGWVLRTDRSSKLDSKAEVCIHLGFDESKKGYRMLNVRSGKIELSRDVRFDEGQFTQCAALLADLGGRDDVAGFSDHLERVMSDNEVRLVQMLSLLDEPAAAPAQPGVDTEAQKHGAAPAAQPDLLQPQPAVVPPEATRPEPAAPLSHPSQKPNEPLPLRRSERERHAPAKLAEFELTKPKAAVDQGSSSSPAAPRGGIGASAGRGSRRCLGLRFRVRR